MKTLTTTTTLALIALLAGCTTEVVDGQQQPVVRASEPGTIDGCSDVRSACTMSEPSTCYEYCADPPPACEPVEVCTASYPMMCRTICGDTSIDPGDCDVVTSVSDEDGVVIVACIDSGEPGTGGGSEPGAPGTGDGSGGGEPGGGGGSGGGGDGTPGDPIPL